MKFSTQQSPRLNIHLESALLENFQELFSLVSLAFAWLHVYLNWDVLPARIPTHFGISGTPDGWGSKSTLLMLPLIGAGLYLLLTVVAHFPHLSNLPWEITEANAPAQCRMFCSLLTWLIIYTGVELCLPGIGHHQSSNG